MIYLDNAATSWPKPPEVLRAMTDVLESAGGNPGRSGHSLSIEAARVVYNTREALAGFFNCPDPQRIVFTLNATHAINLALRGILRAGDGVVTTSMEHNAVMRPLRYLEAQSGVTVKVVPCREDGGANLDQIMRSLEESPRLVVINHASNVTGTIQPVAEIARLAHRAGALLLVDAAQTAGALPIDVAGMGIDLLAFTGHKGLLGPPGVGGLILGQHVDFRQIEPLIMGGTGSRSEFEVQPEHLPDRFESGTQNIVGIAGLGAGIQWLNERGLKEVRNQEMDHLQGLISGLRNIPGIKLYGPCDPALTTAIVSFTLAGKTVSEIGLELDEDHGVLSRVGLHCAPSAHRTVGSFPEGTVRLAPGVFTSPDDIHRVISSVARVAIS
jgi:cysteine desulfurase / selenocysteine lyase